MVYSSLSTPGPAARCRRSDIDVPDEPARCGVKVIPAWLVRTVALSDRGLIAQGSRVQPVAPERRVLVVCPDQHLCPTEPAERRVQLATSGVGDRVRFRHVRPGSGDVDGRGRVYPPGFVERRAHLVVDGDVDAPAGCKTLARDRD